MKLCKFMKHSHDEYVSFSFKKLPCACKSCIKSVKNIKSHKNRNFWLPSWILRIRFIFRVVNLQIQVQQRRITLETFVNKILYEMPFAKRFLKKNAK